MDLQTSSHSQHRSSLQHKDKGEPTFACTICWRLQYAPSKPKLLGSSARIVCRPCWRAVLDLSICWVCGEYIIRGDEVVSLGWCFWHRVCFGCLVCGTRMSVPVDVGDGDGNGEGCKGRGGMGVELEQIPLCGVCGVEMSGQSEGRVLERGVENVTRSDGGLSRDRLEKWSEVSNEEVCEERLTDERRDSSSKERKSSLHRKDISKQGRKSYSKGSGPPSSKTGKLHALIHGAMNTRISGDGNVDEHPREGLIITPIGVTQPFPDHESSHVYVSVFDPIGEPAFQASKTKPLPKWMQLLPNNIYREGEEKSEEIHDKANQNLHDTKSPKIVIDSMSHTPSKQQHDSPALSDNSTPFTPIALGEQANLPTPPMNIPNARPRTRGGSKMVFEPNPGIELADGGHRIDRRSHTVDSAYMTPPEYPRPKTPFPRPVTLLTHHESSSYFSHRPGANGVEASIEMEGSYCDLGAQRTGRSPAAEGISHRQRLSPRVVEQNPLLPIESSEYLDKYQPRIAATPYTKYVAKDPEPILNKLKRQRVGHQNPEYVAEERKVKRHGGEGARDPKLDIEEGALDPKRRDLHQELRNLFCGSGEE